MELLYPRKVRSTLVFCSWKTSGPVNSSLGSCNPWTSKNTTSSGNRVSAESVIHYLREAMQEWGGPLIQ